MGSYRAVIAAKTYKFDKSCFSKDYSGDPIFDNESIQRAQVGHILCLSISSMMYSIQIYD